MWCAQGIFPVNMFRISEEFVDAQDEVLAPINAVSAICQVFPQPRSGAASTGQFDEAEFAHTASSAI
jgi:hypothetical protein